LSTHRKPVTGTEVRNSSLKTATNWHI